jgi:hypothetical protein
MCTCIHVGHINYIEGIVIKTEYQVQQYSNVSLKYFILTHRLFYKFVWMVYRYFISKN